MLDHTQPRAPFCGYDMKNSELKAILAQLPDDYDVVDGNTDKNVIRVYGQDDRKQIIFAVVDNRGLRTPLDDILDQV
jgi:hypothetical protein